FILTSSAIADYLESPRQDEKDGPGVKRTWKPLATIRPWQWCLAGGVLALTLLDAFVPAIARYFAANSDTTSLLTSLLLRALGYAVVEALIRQVETRRWQKVRSIALISVGRGVLNQRRAMQFCLSLDERKSDVDFNPHHEFDSMVTILEAHEVAHGRDPGSLRL